MPSGDKTYLSQVVHGAATGAGLQVLHFCAFWQLLQLEQPANRAAPNIASATIANFFMTFLL